MSSGLALVERLHEFTGLRPGGGDSRTRPASSSETAGAETPFSTLVIVSELTGGYHVLLPAL